MYLLYAATSRGWAVFLQLLPSDCIHRIIIQESNIGFLFAKKERKRNQIPFPSFFVISFFGQRSKSSLPDPKCIHALQLLPLHFHQKAGFGVRLYHSAHHRDRIVSSAL